MSSAVCLRTIIVCAMSTFMSITLTACGGGGSASSGNDKPNEPAATPSQQLSNALAINGGDTTLATGQYKLDTSYEGASSTQNVDGDELEEVDPKNAALDSQFIFAQAHPAKFAVLLAPSSGQMEDVFACRSSAWSDAEIAQLNQSIHSQVPLCPDSISIDTARHQISFSNLLLPSLLQAGKSIKLSANFSWTLQSTPTEVVGTGANSGDSASPASSSSPSTGS